MPFGLNVNWSALPESRSGNGSSATFSARISPGLRQHDWIASIHIGHVEFALRSRDHLVAVGRDVEALDATEFGTHLTRRPPIGDVGTVGREVTDRLLIINEHHLEAVLNRYAIHYDHRRPHRALNSRHDDQTERSQSRTACRYAADQFSADCLTSTNTQPPDRGSDHVADSGLGLAIVAGIAEAHGGTTFAGNRAGGGATLGFTTATSRLLPVH
ncbi:hypothetical protein [Saccharothrix luteola]|uniref:hypothetical protein n=1 Tax=Saccharothrix luteola TaxID=2893018 RepID=UPI001E343005|nr:hypothetical protein [Saccharothrix luteola]MCC8249811.1 hypothetical protein [Saccharothrix luteola]